MKILLTLFVLFFSSSVVAEDISEFEIEGMSIGDSLLDYVDIDEIEMNKEYYPNSKKWARFSKKVSSFETYDGFQVHFKVEDSKYLIGTIDGLILYQNNIEDCYKKMDEIVTDLSKIFKDAKIEYDKSSHDYDKSGKSIVTSVEYWFESGDVAVIECTDWSNEIGIVDKLSIKIGTKEFVDWINNEAY